MRRAWGAALAIAILLAAGRLMDSPLAVLKLEELPGEVLAAVHFIDVGQGDATLILTRERTALIDGGDVWAGRRLLSYLEGVDVRQIDYIVASSPHESHIGGLSEVLGSVAIGTLLIPASQHTTAAYVDLLRSAAARDVACRVPRAGQEIHLAEGVTLEILAPLDDFKEGGDTGTAGTVVARLVAGRVAFLFSGDMDQPAENRLMRMGAGIKSEVLKVGRHGSRCATSALFLDRVSPSTAVISVGAYNEHGLPHVETLRRLESACEGVWRTDRHGTIVVVTDGQALAVLPERRPDGGGS